MHTKEGGQLEESLIWDKTSAGQHQEIKLDELRSKDRRAKGTVYKVMRNKDESDANKDQSEEIFTQEMVQRWYLREGHSFGFDRKCEIEFGGVVLPHFDEFGRGYCFDDDIEQLRVTKLEGWGIPYESSLGNNDFLFKNMRWQNKNQENELTNFYMYNDKYDEKFERSRDAGYHCFRYCCKCLHARKVNYSTDDVAFEYLEDLKAQKEQQESSVALNSTNDDDAYIDVGSKQGPTCMKYFFNVMQFFLIFVTISMIWYSGVFFIHLDDENFYTTALLALTILLNFLSLKQLIFHARTYSVRARGDYYIALILCLISQISYLIYGVTSWCCNQNLVINGEDRFDDKQMMKITNKQSKAVYNVILPIIPMIILSIVLIILNKKFYKEQDKENIKRKYVESGYDKRSWHQIGNINHNLAESDEQQEGLWLFQIRADFFKALFTFFVSKDDGLGHDYFDQNDPKFDPMGSRDIRIHVKLKEYAHKFKFGKTVLVGFQGFTDKKGDIAVIRPLLLEKRWVKYEKKACCKSCCEGVEQWVDHLALLIHTVLAGLIFCYDYTFWKNCCCKRERDNIADDRGKRSEQPMDIIDHKWEPQFDANLEKTTKRDFLKLTILGRFVSGFQVIRNWLLLSTIIYILSQTFTSSEMPTIDQRGVYEGGELKLLRWFYVSADLFLALPVFLLVVQVISSDNLKLIQKAELLARGIKTILTNDKEFLIVVLYLRIDAYYFASTEPGKFFGGFGMSNLALVEYHDQLLFISWSLFISIVISAAKRALATAAHALCNLYLFYYYCDVYCQYFKDCIFFCWTVKREDINNLAREERKWFKQYQKIFKEVATNPEKQKECENAKEESIRLCREYNDKLKIYEEFEQRQKQMLEDPLHQKYVVFVTNYYYSFTEDYFMQQIYERGFSAQYIDEDYVQLSAKSSAQSAYWRIFLDYVPQFYLLVQFGYILQAIEGKTGSKHLHCARINQTKVLTQDFKNKFMKDCKVHISEAKFDFFGILSFLNMSNFETFIVFFFKGISVLDIIHRFYVSSFRWRENFIKNIKHYINDVIHREGVTMIDQKSTQTIMKGRYFSSFGPEAFIELIRTNAKVYENHCTILRQFKRLGQDQDIKIKGDYKEWITYLAKYKLDLKKLNQFETLEDLRSGCIMMGLYDDEYFQVGESINHVKHQKTEYKEWYELLFSLDFINDFNKKIFQKDKPELDDEETEKFIQQVNDDLQQFKLFKSSDATVRKHIKSGQKNYQFTIRIGVCPNRYNQQQNFFVKQDYNMEDFTDDPYSELPSKIDCDKSLVKRPPDSFSFSATYTGEWDYETLSKTGKGEITFSPQFSINDKQFGVKGVFLEGQLHGEGKYYGRDKYFTNEIVFKQGRFERGALKTGIYISYEYIRFADPLEKDQMFEDENCMQGLFKQWDQRFMTMARFNSNAKAHNTPEEIAANDLWTKQYRIPIHTESVFRPNNQWQMDNIIKTGERNSIKINQAFAQDNFFNFARDDQKLYHPILVDQLAENPHLNLCYFGPFYEDCPASGKFSSDQNQVNILDDQSNEVNCETKFIFRYLRRPRNAIYFKSDDIQQLEESNATAKKGVKIKVLTHDQTTYQNPEPEKFINPVQSVKENKLGWYNEHALIDKDLYEKLEPLFDKVTERLNIGYTTPELDESYKSHANLYKGVGINQKSFLMEAFEDNKSISRMSNEIGDVYVLEKNQLNLIYDTVQSESVKLIGKSITLNAIPELLEILEIIGGNETQQEIWISDLETFDMYKKQYISIKKDPKVPVNCLLRLL